MRSAQESLWLEDQKQDAKDDKKFILRTDLDVKSCAEFAFDPLSGSDALLLTPTVRDTVAKEVALLAHNQSSNQEVYQLLKRIARLGELYQSRPKASGKQSVIAASSTDQFADFEHVFNHVVQRASQAVDIAANAPIDENTGSLLNALSKALKALPPLSFNSLPAVHPLKSAGGVVDLVALNAMNTISDELKIAPIVASTVLDGALVRGSMSTALNACVKLLSVADADVDRAIITKLVDFPATARPVQPAELKLKEALQTLRVREGLEPDTVITGELTSFSDVPALEADAKTVPALPAVATVLAQFERTSATYGPTDDELEFINGKRERAKIDSKGPAASHDTLSSFNCSGSQYGCSFELRAKKRIVITGFDANMSQSPNHHRIFHRVGEPGGIENALRGGISSWTEIFNESNHVLSATGGSNGVNPSVRDLQIVCEAGSCHYFYFWRNNSSGMQFGNSISSQTTYGPPNPDFTIYSGCYSSGSVPFNDVSSHYEFGGRVLYYGYMEHDPVVPPPPAPAPLHFEVNPGTFSALMAILDKALPVYFGTEPSTDGVFRCNANMVRSCLRLLQVHTYQYSLLETPGFVLSADLLTAIKRVLEQVTTTEPASRDGVALKGLIKLNKKYASETFRSALSLFYPTNVSKLAHAMDSLVAVKDADTAIPLSDSFSAVLSDACESNEAVASVAYDTLTAQTARLFAVYSSKWEYKNLSTVLSQLSDVVTNAVWSRVHEQQAAEENNSTPTPGFSVMLPKYLAKFALFFNQSYLEAANTVLRAAVGQFDTKEAVATVAKNLRTSVVGTGFRRFLHGLYLLSSPDRAADGLVLLPHLLTCLQFLQQIKLKKQHTIVPVLAIDAAGDLIHTASQLLFCLLRGQPPSPEEKANTKWLNSNVFSGGLSGAGADLGPHFQHVGREDELKSLLLGEANSQRDDIPQTLYAHLVDKKESKVFSRQCSMQVRKESDELRRAVFEAIVLHLGEHENAVRVGLELAADKKQAQESCAEELQVFEATWAVIMPLQTWINGIKGRDGIDAAKRTCEQALRRVRLITSLAPSVTVQAQAAADLQPVSFKRLSSLEDIKRQRGDGLTTSGKSNWNKSRVILSMIRKSLGAMDKLKETLQARDNLVDESKLSPKEAIGAEILSIVKLPNETHPDGIFDRILLDQRKRALGRAIGFRLANSFLQVMDDLVQPDASAESNAVVHKNAALFLKHVSSAFSRFAPSLWPVAKFNTYKPSHPTHNLQSTGFVKTAVFEGFTTFLSSLTTSKFLAASPHAALYALNMFAFEVEHSDLEQLAKVKITSFLEPLVSFTASNGALLTESVENKATFIACGQSKSRHVPFTARLAAWNITRMYSYIAAEKPDSSFSGPLLEFMFRQISRSSQQALSAKASEASETKTGNGEDAQEETAWTCFTCLFVNAMESKTCVVCTTQDRLASKRSWLADAKERGDVKEEKKSDSKSAASEIVCGKVWLFHPQTNFYANRMPSSNFCGGPNPEPFEIMNDTQGRSLPGPFHIRHLNADMSPTTDWMRHYSGDWDCFRQSNTDNDTCFRFEPAPDGCWYILNPTRGGGSWLAVDTSNNNILRCPSPGEQGNEMFRRWQVIYLDESGKPVQKGSVNVDWKAEASDSNVDSVGSLWFVNTLRSTNPEASAFSMASLRVRPPSSSEFNVYLSQWLRMLLRCVSRANFAASIANAQWANVLLNVLRLDTQSRMEASNDHTNAQLVARLCGSILPFVDPNCSELVLRGADMVHFLISGIGRLICPDHFADIKTPEIKTDTPVDIVEKYNPRRSNYSHEVGAELVELFRSLLLRDAWRQLSAPVLEQAATSLKEIKASDAVAPLIAAMAILGGYVEPLRVGGRVQNGEQTGVLTKITWDFEKPKPKEPAAPAAAANVVARWIHSATVNLDGGGVVELTAQQVHDLIVLPQVPVPYHRLDQPLLVESLSSFVFERQADVSRGLRARMVEATLSRQAMKVLSNLFARPGLAQAFLPRLPQLAQLSRAASTLPSSGVHGLEFRSRALSVFQTAELPKQALGGEKKEEKKAGGAKAPSDIIPGKVWLFHPQTNFYANRVPNSNFCGGPNPEPFEISLDTQGRSLPGPFHIRHCNPDLTPVNDAWFRHYTGDWDCFRQSNTDNDTCFQFNPAGDGEWYIFNPTRSGGSFLAVDTSNNNILRCPSPSEQPNEAFRRWKVIYLGDDGQPLRSGGGGDGDALSMPLLPSSAFGILTGSENASEDRASLESSLIDPISNRTLKIQSAEPNVVHVVTWRFHSKKDVSGPGGEQQASGSEDLANRLREAANRRGAAVNTSGKIKLGIVDSSNLTTYGSKASEGVYIRANDLGEENAFESFAHVVCQDSEVLVPDKAVLSFQLPQAVHIPNHNKPGCSFSMSLRQAKLPSRDGLAKLLSIAPADASEAKAGIGFTLITEDLKEFTVTLTNFASNSTASTKIENSLFVAGDEKQQATATKFVTVVQYAANEVGGVREEKNFGGYRLYFDGECVLDTLTAADFATFNATWAEPTEERRVLPVDSVLTFAKGINAYVGNMGFWRFALSAKQVDQLVGTPLVSLAKEYSAASNSEAKSEKYIFAADTDLPRNMKIIGAPTAGDSSSGAATYTFDELLAAYNSGDMKEVKVRSEADMRANRDNSNSDYMRAFASSDRDNERWALADQTLIISRVDPSDNTVECKTSSSDRTCWFTADCFLRAGAAAGAKVQANFVAVTGQDGEATVGVAIPADATGLVFERTLAGELKKYSFSFDFALSAMPASKTTLLTFGTPANGNLSVDEKGVLSVLDKPTTIRLEAGRVNSLRLAFTKAASYGYVICNKKVASYFRHTGSRLNFGSKATLLPQVAGSVHRVSLDLEVQKAADVLAGVVVAAAETKSLLHGMGWPESWINEGLRECDDQKPLAIEYIIKNLERLEVELAETNRKNALTAATSNLASIGFPQAWCEEALSNAILTDEERESVKDAPARLSALLQQKSLQYLLDHTERLRSASSGAALTPVVSVVVPDIKEEKKQAGASEYPLIPDAGEEVAAGSAVVEHVLSFYEQALSKPVSVGDSDVPLHPLKANFGRMGSKTAQTDDEKKNEAKYTAALTAFEGKVAEFQASLLLTETALSLAYARSAMVNVLKAAPEHAVFQRGFSWFLRIVESGLPDGLDIVRQHFLTEIVREAPALAQAAPPTPSQGLLLDATAAPTIAQLIQECLYQLLSVAKLKEQAVSEQAIIDGACANPRMAIFLLDLFMHATGEFADSHPEPLASHLRHLRAHVFNPVILGLVFEAVPVSDAAFRVIFLRLLASLVVLNSQARKAGGKGGATLVHFEGQRFLALKALMIKITRRAERIFPTFCAR